MPSKKSVCQLLLLALLGTAPALHAQQQTPAADLVKQGVALFDQGKPDEAVLRYQQALKQEPAHPTARYELAMTYNALGRNEEAAALCRELLRDDPAASPQLYGTYGNALDGLKKPREAAKIYQQGLKRYPNDGSLHFNLGVTQATSLDQPAEALYSMQQALRCRPTHRATLNALGLLAAQQNQRVPALLALLRQLQLEPTGDRATAARTRFDNLVGRGVEKTGANAITINISSATLKNAGKKGAPDNFAAADMFLSLNGALDYDEKNKDKTPDERLVEKLGSLIQMLDELHPETQEGFTWQFMVPYFVALKKQGHLPALVYAMQAGRPAAPAVQSWLQAHTNTVAEFEQWSAEYQWPK